MLSSEGPTGSLASNRSSSTVGLGSKHEVCCPQKELAGWPLMKAPQIAFVRQGSPMHEHVFIPKMAPKSGQWGAIEWAGVYGGIGCFFPNSGEMAQTITYY